jgi:hypothetical protein
MRRSLLAYVVCASVPALALAQEATTPIGSAHDRAVPTSRAARLDGTIRIDGRLDEAAWASAPVTDRFTQIDPDEGRPASQRTEVRVLYDDEALYVGVRLHDNGPVTARLGRRDMPLGDSDWFGLMIDSYHDHRTAFGFDVNPAGVRRDEVKIINSDDNSWDPVWEVATSLPSDGGWIAEYRVPFSQLRFGRAAEQTWGVQFERVIGRTREYAVSTFIPKSDQGGVPRYGHLTGLRDIRPGKRLEVLPYTVSRAEYVDRGPNPFRTKDEYALSAGVDLLYRVTPNLALNATINPDFGQVEVDPAVVNLGVYETFFEEKRPFFIEGSDIFDFGANSTSGGQLFYSRRVGRAPSLAPPTPLADIPDVTTILGAAKLSGKPGGWSIGVLEAVTAREEARYRDAERIDRDFTVEPLTNYFVARARRDLRGGRTFVGGIVSAVNRRLDSDALQATMRKAGYAAGIDFRHEFVGRRWVVEGDIEGSRVEGTPSAMRIVQRQSNHFFQRPDADHLDVDSAATALNGYSMNLALRKQEGRHWRGAVSGALTSPRYEVNDLGFAVRTDRKDLAANITYVENSPGRVLRNYSISANGRSEHNFAWEPILTIAGAQANLRTLGYWSLFAQVQRQFEAYDDRLTRGGPIAVRPANVGSFVEIASDSRKPLTLSLAGSGTLTDHGGWDWSASAGLGVKSSTWWNLEVTPSILRERFPAQYVATAPDAGYVPTFGQRYVFAPLDYTEVGLETRLNVTFSPRLSLETYVQPLISTGDYGAAMQLVAPKTFDFVPSPAVDADALDFNLRSLRGNAVLRWEWRQGSTLYLAWQQRRFDYAERLGDFRFGRDRRALFRARPDNIFILKANYWINP